MPDQQRLALNAQVIQTFRDQGGVGVATRFGLPDVPLLLLTTVGARTGQQRVSALGCLPDGADWVVFAANGGRPNRPGWYHNLVATPDAVIEVATDTGLAAIDVHAQTLPDGPERDALWERQCAVVQRLQAFQETAPALVPVVRLRRR